MNPKQKEHVNYTKEDGVKITLEELKTFGFSNGLSEPEQEELLDFVYKLSMVLYQSVSYESA